MGSSFQLPPQQRSAWINRPSPSKLAQAVDEIDLNDTAAAADNLADLLDTLNGTAISATRRRRCVAPFIDPARALTDALTGRLALESAPLSSSVLAQTKRLASMWSKLAVAYLLALQEGRRYAGPHRGAAALSALQALGQMLLMHYHEYAAVPAGAWHAIHQCYATVSGLKINAATAGELETVYKQILIFGGTGPYRLRQSEQASFYRVLSDWAALVFIRRSRNVQAKGSTLVFRADDDEAPMLYPFDHLPDTQNLNFIDTAPLAARAHHHLSLIEADDEAAHAPGQALGTDTLRALIAAWSGSPQRRFPRVEVGRGLSLYAGLERIHAKLQGRSVGASIEGHVLNESATGFSVGFEQPDPASLAIGELVLAEHAAFNGAILGMVRWLRRQSDDYWIAGVEGMSREARAVRLSKSNDDEFQALLLPANAAAYAPASLVIPRSLAAEAHELELDDEGRETAVKLERQLEISASFCQYRFS